MKAECLITCINSGLVCVWGNYGIRIKIKTSLKVVKYKKVYLFLPIINSKRASTAVSDPAAACWPSDIEGE